MRYYAFTLEILHFLEFGHNGPLVKKMSTFFYFNFWFITVNFVRVKVMLDPDCFGLPLNSKGPFKG